MCGIAGFIEHSAASGSRNQHDERVAVLNRMCQIIKHRGPDDQGLMVKDGVALGMRRLSIIDLAGGHQPISGCDDSATVVFNGEIYNYRELQRELEARGHCFHTHSDTEAIVHAYEEYGAACVDHLRGMFAFALWDARARKLSIARGRVGKKLSTFVVATPLPFFALAVCGVVFAIVYLAAIWLLRILSADEREGARPRSAHVPTPHEALLATRGE